MSNVDLDAMLDTVLDDLEDLPEFKPFPRGAHKAKVTLEAKAVNDTPCIEANFVYIEPLQLADPEEKAPKEGDTANVLFMMNNEYGRGNFKKFAAYFKEQFNLSTNREVIDTVQDMECAIVTSLRADKNNPDKQYMGITEIQAL